jgi:hypothetical protein
MGASVISSYFDTTRDNWVYKTCGPLQRFVQTTGRNFSVIFVSLDWSRHLITLENNYILVIGILNHL